MLSFVAAIFFYLLIAFFLVRGEILSRLPAILICLVDFVGPPFRNMTPPRAMKLVAVAVQVAATGAGVDSISLS